MRAAACCARKHSEPLVLPLRTEVTLPIESRKGWEATDADKEPGTGVAGEQSLSTDADKEPGTGVAGEQSFMMQLPVYLGVQYERCLLCVHQRGNGQRPRARVCRAS